jgi:hypothetical protein
MASWLSEDLNEREVVTDKSVRLTGWSLFNSGSEDRYVAFKDADLTGPLIVVPPGDEKNMTGLNKPFPSGLAIESLTGDGTLIANVFFEVREPRSPEGEEVEADRNVAPAQQIEDEEAE